MTQYPVLSPVEEASLLRLARWKTRSWRDHPDYEDMLSESYLAAWRSYCRAVETGKERPLSVATNGAGYGPINWLVRWFGRSYRESDARSRVEFVPLLEADHGSAPGPEETVLDQWERAQAWEVFAAGLSACTVRQREVLYRLFVLGQEQQEVARALGITGQVVGKMRDRGLENCRKAGGQKRTPTAEVGRYPLCRQGHPQVPENQVKMTRGGVFVGTRCRLCGMRHSRNTRARARLRGTAGQDRAGEPGGAL